MKKKMKAKQMKKKSSGVKRAPEKMKKTAVKKTRAKKPVVKRKKKVLSQPKGYNTITPYLIVNGAKNAIVFYKTAFGAKIAMSMEHPGGKIGHAELKMGDAKIMLADEFPEMHAHSPKKFGGSPVSIHLYVKNVDSVVEKAVSLGAKLERPVQNMFYGDRSGTIIDPYGHTWYIATHVEDVTPAKLRKRAAELFNKKD